MDTSDRWSAPVSAWLLCCFCLAYLPDVGHGFIADDFGWLAHSRLASLADLGHLLISAPTGFYRPVSSLSFTISGRLAGLSPFGQALVNVALVFATAAAIVALCRARGFSRLGGLFAAGLWMFNLHGIGMAVTWVSGRTSLLATLFAVLAANAQCRGRSWIAGGFTLLALGSKEEALPLAVILLAWMAVAEWRRRRRDASARGAAIAAPVREAIASVVGAARQVYPAWLALAVYLAVRSVSGAITLATAPPPYQLTAHWSVLVPNILEYADRALTVATIVTAIVVLVAVAARPRPALRLAAHERDAIVDGAVWLVLGFGVSGLVPVRSDLYVCLPSIGSALMALGAGAAAARLMPARRRVVGTVVLLALPLLLWPVYHARNAPARADAELSTSVLRRAFSVLRERPDLTRVEVYQYADERPSIARALGGGLSPALELGLGRHFETQLYLTAPSDPWPSPRVQTLRITVIDHESAAVTPPTPSP